MAEIGKQFADVYSVCVIWSAALLQLSASRDADLAQYHHGSAGAELVAPGASQTQTCIGASS